jgi:CubicO group peptidase (beta-lactamase class C family)
LRVVALVALGDTIDDGVLTLDDTVTQWLDDPVVAKIPNVDRITLRQLLNHTSGVYDYYDDDSPFYADAYFGEGADWARVWSRSWARGCVRASISSSTRCACARR